MWPFNMSLFQFVLIMLWFPQFCMLFFVLYNYKLQLPIFPFTRYLEDQKLLERRGIQRSLKIAKLTNFFRIKHVVEDASVRGKLLNTKIDDEKKLKILEEYVNKMFESKPNLKTPRETKRWRVDLMMEKSGTTYILSDTKTIMLQLRLGSQVKRGLVKALGKQSLAKISIEKLKPVDGEPDWAVIKWTDEDRKPQIKVEGFSATRNTAGDFVRLRSEKRRN